MKQLLIGTVAAGLAATTAFGGLSATINSVADTYQQQQEIRMADEHVATIQRLDQQARWNDAMQPVTQVAVGIVIVGGAVGAALAAVGGGIGVSRYINAQSLRAQWLAYPDKRGWLPIILEPNSGGQDGRDGRAERAEQAQSTLDGWVGGSEGGAELTWEQLAPRWALTAYNGGGELSRAYWVGKEIDGYEISRGGYDAMIVSCQKLGWIVKRGGAWQFARHVGRAALHQAIAVAE